MIKVLKYIAVPLVLFCLMGLVYIYSSNRKKQKSHRILSAIKIGSGYINSLNNCTKCALTYNYTFSDKGINYSGVSGSSGNTDEYHYLGVACLYKSFPVAYDSLHPEISKLLITPVDFKVYKIPFPDSLNWVKRYVQ